MTSTSTKELSLEHRLQHLRLVVCAYCRAGFPWQEELASHLLESGFARCDARIYERGDIPLSGLGVDRSTVQVLGLRNIRTLAHLEALNEIELCQAMVGTMGAMSMTH